MNEPKMPEPRKNWEAINIFLFSNGQQYTPPRKYHLVLDELKSWDNVLSYLAHSQYGPQTSTVDLYSLEGRKINTPLELTDSAAYVAIKPSEEFIQTGYSHYLIKASRSWEKRQEKILTSEDITVTEDTTRNIKNVQSKSDVTSGVEYIKTVNDFTRATPVLDNAVSNIKKTITKPNPSFNTSQLRKNNMAIKRQQHTMIPTEKNRNDESIENQINSKRKEISYLKCIKGPKRPPVLPKNVKANNNKPNVNLKKMNENASNIKQLSKAEMETDLKIILSNQNTSIHKSEIDINFNVTDLDKIRQPNTIYKERETLQTERIDEKTDEEANLVGQLNKISDNGKDNFKKAEDSLSLIEAKMKSVTQGRHTKDQSISADRGGVIKLKFNIEVRDFQPYGNQARKESLKATQSYISFVATEKASQANININLSDVTLLKYDNDLLKRKESLETLLTINRNIFSNNENPKIIIINCSCDQFDADSKSIQMQCEKKNRNLIYLLPSREKNEKPEICICDKNYFKTKPEDQATTDTFSNKTIDRRVSISPEALYNTQEISANRKEIKNGITELQQQMSIPPNEPVKQDVQTQSEHINQNPQIEHTDTEATIAKHDKYTQTDWCNMVLEARKQEDGHYALHLPPLQSLLRNNF